MFGNVNNSPFSWDWDSVEAGPSPTKRTRTSDKDNDFFDTLDPEYSLLPRDEEKVNAALTLLRLTEDTPERKSRASAVRGATTTVMRRLFDTNPPEYGTPDFHRQGTAKLQDSPWAGWVMRELAAIDRACAHHPEEGPPTLYNMSHICSPVNESQKPKGLHFCPPGHKYVHLIIDSTRIYNPVTRVFGAEFQMHGSGKTKFSTFFPISIRTEKELISVLENAEEVAREGNFALWKAIPKSGETPFHVEAILKHGGALIHSAYPLFYFGEWEEDAAFEITSTLTLSSSEVFVAILDALAEEEKPIRYLIGEEAVIDIAPQLQGLTTIPHGICFSIPLAFLKEQPGFEECFAQLLDTRNN